MRTQLRRHVLPLILGGLMPFSFAGCGGTSPEPSSVISTPPEVIQPAPSDESSPATKPSENVNMPEGAEAFALATPANGTTEAASTAPSSPAETAVKLIPMTFDEYLARAATKPDAKLTIVDAWATWCAPCKENFPHLVELHKRLGPEGLNVVSLSMDDPGDEKAVREASEFLESQNATFTNVILKEEFGGGFERFDISAIPAVFLYDPSGKEVRRFTLEDSDNQFTNEQVDQVVELLLDGKPLPEDAPGDPPPTK